MKSASSSTSTQKIVIAALMILLPFSVGAVFHFVEYYTITAGYHDAGITFHFVKRLWHYGHFPSMTTHFTPSYYPLAVVVELLGGKLLPFMLLHPLAMGVSAYLLFLLAKERLRSTTVAVFLYLAYIFNPYTLQLIRSVHYEVFAFPFAFAFCLYWFRQRHWLALLCLLIALSVKEDVVIYAALLVLIHANRQNWRSAAVYLGVVAVYFLVLLEVMWPWLYPDKKDLFLANWPYGNSKAEVVLHLLRTWQVSLPRAFMIESSRDFWTLFAFVPLLLTPIRALALVAVLFLWTNSGNPVYARLLYYYIWPLIFLVFPMLILGMDNIKMAFSAAARRSAGIPAARSSLIRLVQKAAHAVTATLQRHVNVVCAAIFVGLIGIAAWYDFISPPPNAPFLLLPEKVSATGHDRKVRRLVRNVLAKEPGDTIAVDFALASYVGDRKAIVHHPDVEPILRAEFVPDIVFLDLNYRDPYGSHDLRAAIANHVRNSKVYEKVFDDDGIALYRLVQSERKTVVR